MFRNGLVIYGTLLDVRVRLCTNLGCEPGTVVCNHGAEGLDVRVLFGTGEPWLER